jgi:pimeloyl-ACP methyl ester carboxylesterase
VSEYAARASYRLSRGPARAVPLLLLHGLGGDAGQLWPYADAARDQLAPDLRGHGATPVTGPDDCFTFAGLTTDLIALLDRLDFPAAVVAGVSMGAGIAARLAVHYSERVRGLVLIRPAWLDRPEPNLDALRLAGHLLRRHGAGGLATFLASAEYRATAEVSPAAAASLAGQFGAPQAAERAGRLIRMPDSVPLDRLADLGRVRVPAVVAGAPADPQHPLAMARAWAAALPGSRLAQTPPRDQDPAGYQATLAGAVAGLLQEAA